MVAKKFWKSSIDLFGEDVNKNLRITFWPTLYITLHYIEIFERGLSKNRKDHKVKN